MALSMYQVTIPVFIRMLNNLLSILAKASQYAEAKKIDPAVLINARLAPDMFALARQIQIASDTAKGCGARLAEMEIPSYADTETTFAELHERITKTIQFLKSINKDKFNGCEDRQIVLKARGKDIHFTGQDYVLSFVIPNFYFHVTTAYDILRHNGLEIGKMDFLGAE
ncbi:DUF1993 domain-containing protein [Legionella sp. WA2022007384]